MMLCLWTASPQPSLEVVRNLGTALGLFIGEDRVVRSDSHRGESK
jgi:hypothetical protein